MGAKRTAAEEQPTTREGARVLRFKPPEHDRRDAGALAIGSVGGIEPDSSASVRSRRLVTVLFTDIVESTRWISSLGDQRWLDLQDQHEELMRVAVRRFHGSYLRSTGDGFVVTFTSSVAALLAASSVVEGTRALGIEMRAALHSGECEIRGRKAAGIVFHICARIITLAQAGEILVSRTVRDVSSGSTLTFAERGSHELRGLPGQWDLYRAGPCSDEDRRPQRVMATSTSPVLSSFKSAALGAETMVAGPVTVA